MDQNSGENIVYTAKEIAEARVTGFPSFITLAALRSANVTETTVRNATEITEAYANRPVRK